MKAVEETPKKAKDLLGRLKNKYMYNDKQLQKDISELQKLHEKLSSKKEENEDAKKLVNDLEREITILKSKLELHK